MCLPRTEAQALIAFHSPTDFILTIAVVFSPVSSPAHKPRLPLPLSQQTPRCTQSDPPPPRVPALARRSLASLRAPVGTRAPRGTWGWQRWPPWGRWAEAICGFWLVSIPSWPCKGLLCSPGRLLVLTIAPFEVTRTPRLGATTGLRDQVNPAPLCPGHPREGDMGEQTSYSLLRDLAGSGAWHTAHRATTGLAKRVFGQIPHIALELEQKPTRTKSCPSLHPGNPPDIAASCMRGTEGRGLHFSFFLVWIMNYFQLIQESTSLFDLYIFTLSTKSLMSFQWRVI